MVDVISFRSLSNKRQKDKIMDPDSLAYFVASKKVYFHISLLAHNLAFYWKVALVSRLASRANPSHIGDIIKPLITWDWQPALDCGISEISHDTDLLVRFANWLGRLWGHEPHAVHLFVHHFLKEINGWVAPEQWAAAMCEMEIFRGFVAEYSTIQSGISLYSVDLAA